MSILKTMSHFENKHKKISIRLVSWEWLTSCQPGDIPEEEGEESKSCWQSSCCGVKCSAGLVWRARLFFTQSHSSSETISGAHGTQICLDQRWSTQEPGTVNTLFKVSFFLFYFKLISLFFSNGHRMRSWIRERSLFVKEFFFLVVSVDIKTRNGTGMSHDARNIMMIG